MYLIFILLLFFALLLINSCQFGRLPKNKKFLRIYLRNNNNNNNNHNNKMKKEKIINSMQYK